MGNIIGGLALIGVGIAIGDSIFLGNPSVIGVGFDLLGLFWIGKGLYQMKTAPG